MLQTTENCQLLVHIESSFFDKISLQQNLREETFLVSTGFGNTRESVLQFNAKN